MASDRFDRLENLVIELKESLGREIQNLDRGMQEGFQAMAIRFDNQASRLDRHAALWQTSHRWSIERLEKNRPQ